MKRGEIYLVDLPVRGAGHDLQGRHPAIIVTNEVFNRNVRWKTVTVVPISDAPAQTQRSYGVLLPKGAGGLRADSVALCHQITTIDRSLLIDHWGELDSKLMAKIEEEIRTILYL